MARARTTAIRAALVEGLLRAATPLEAKYLLKLMLADMRIGTKASADRRGHRARRRRGGRRCSPRRHAGSRPGPRRSARFCRHAGEAKMTLFHPLGFMLASPVDTPEEAVARFTEPPPRSPRNRQKRSPSRRSARKASPNQTSFPIAAECRRRSLRGRRRSDRRRAGRCTGSLAGLRGGCCLNPVLAFLEDKYDGMRAQVHCGDPADPGRVAIYSRNREDITQSFPSLPKPSRTSPSR